MNLLLLCVCFFVLAFFREKKKFSGSKEASRFDELFRVETVCIEENVFPREK